MNCPGCSYKLKIWDVKAECPACGVNIPNYNWEENLEKDSLRSDAAFAKLKMRLANFKASLVGDKLQIIRLICTFIPLVALVLPLAKVAVNLPFLSDTEHDISFLSIILHIVNTSEVSGALSLLKGELSSEVFLYAFLSLFCIALGVVLAVLSFFILMIRSFRLGWKGCFICNILSALLWTAAGVFFTLFSNCIATTTVDFFISSTPGFGLFIGIAIFAANAVINFTDGRLLDNKRKISDAELKEFENKYNNIL